MKAVGIRELKNRLSQYVAEVRRGEVVLVTDRGTVVAELRPPGAAAAAQDDVPAGLRRLVERGLVRPARGGHDPGLYQRTFEPIGPPGLGRRLLDEERGDR